MNTQNEIKGKAIPIKRKIFEVSICHIVDTYPDTSCLGEYTDELTDGIIVRRDNEFYEKLPREMERDNDGRFIGKGDFIEPLPEQLREFRGFKPYAGGEKIGTKEYYKYGMRDYERMEGLNNGNWYYIGIMAKAKIGISFDGGLTYKIDEITSGGLWGIESDSDKKYIKEVENEELQDLKRTLAAYGFGRSVIAKKLNRDNVEIKEEF
jgi:hypothetical protein